jgi:hypothetical protein
MKSHASGMWWIVAIMAMNTFLLPPELFLHELERLRWRERANEVLHTSSQLPDSDKPRERMFLMLVGVNCGRLAQASQINARV